MLVYPNAKINIGLHVVEKRKDGFHNIETIFYPIPLMDMLEIVPSDSFSFTTSGIAFNHTSNEENICVKAYRMLQKIYSLPPLKIHLYKNIPMGAGLGGGSADAAFMLKMLNQYFDINLSGNRLIQYAEKLGSDCTFFIKNKVSLATGKGEILQNISLNLKDKFLILICPDIYISTKEAYENIMPQAPTCQLSDIINHPIEQWKDMIQNDFEKHIFQEYPIIKDIKLRLYEKGAVYASMTGSGPTVYGIFEKKKNTRKII